MHWRHPNVTAARIKDDQKFLNIFLITDFNSTRIRSLQNSDLVFQKNKLFYAFNKHVQKFENEFYVLVVFQIEFPFDFSWWIVFIRIGCGIIVGCGAIVGCNAPRPIISESNVTDSTMPGGPMDFTVW